MTHDRYIRPLQATVTLDRHIQSLCAPTVTLTTVGPDRCAQPLSSTVAPGRCNQPSCSPTVTLTDRYTHWLLHSPTVTLIGCRQPSHSNVCTQPLHPPNVTPGDSNTGQPLHRDRYSHVTFHRGRYTMTVTLGERYTAAVTPRPLHPLNVTPGDCYAATVLLT